MSPRQRQFRSRRRRRAAFVLLEVLISLTILAVTVAAILRSFTQSLSAVRQLEIQTQAAFFAEQLLDEFEINTPEEGSHEGGFGDYYKYYYYEANLDCAEPDYDRANTHDDVEKYFSMRYLNLKIFYYNPNSMKKPFKAIELDSAIMGFERFSVEFKRQMRQF